MEENILLDRSTNCSKCKQKMEDNEDYCSNCGFPENADQKEKDKFTYRIKLKMNVLNDAKKKLRNVKIILGIMAGLNFIMALIILANAGLNASSIGSLIGAFVFTACIFWVDKQPLTGIMAAFIFYLILQVISFIINPASIFSGIIVKIIFIAIFVKGIKSAKDYKEYSVQLKEMNVI